MNTPYPARGSKLTALENLPETFRSMITEWADTISYMEPAYVTRERHKESVLELVDEVIRRLQSGAEKPFTGFYSETGIAPTETVASALGITSEQLHESYPVAPGDEAIEEYSAFGRYWRALNVQLTIMDALDANKDEATSFFTNPLMRNHEEAAKALIKRRQDAFKAQVAADRENDVTIKQMSDCERNTIRAWMAARSLRHNLRWAMAAKRDPNLVLARLHGLGLVEQNPHAENRWELTALGRETRRQLHVEV